MRFLHFAVSVSLSLTVIACGSTQNATDIAVQTGVQPRVSPRGPGEGGGGGGYNCKKIRHVCLTVRANDSIVKAIPANRDLDRGDCVYWHGMSDDGSHPPSISLIHFINPSEGDHDGKSKNAIPIDDVCHNAGTDCLVYIDLPECVSGPCNYRYTATVNHGETPKHSDPELEVSGSCCIIHRPGQPDCHPPGRRD